MKNEKSSPQPKISQTLLTNPRPPETSDFLRRVAAAPPLREDLRKTSDSRVWKTSDSLRRAAASPVGEDLRKTSDSLKWETPDSLRRAAALPLRDLRKTSDSLRRVAAPPLREDLRKTSFRCETPDSFRQAAAPPLREDLQKTSDFLRRAAARVRLNCVAVCGAPRCCASRRGARTGWEGRKKSPKGARLQGRQFAIFRGCHLLSPQNVPSPQKLPKSNISPIPHDGGL